MTTEMNAVQMDLVIDLLEVLNGDDDYAAAAHQLCPEVRCAAPAPSKAELMIGMNSKEQNASGVSIMDRNVGQICSIGTCAIAAMGACLVLVGLVLYFRADALPS